jgi:diguanylate cyclase (GGDEF)-like protein/PAS domain S-box-containing protein
MLTTSPPIQCDIQKKLHRSLANDYDLFKWVQETDSKGLSFWEIGAAVYFGLNHQLWATLGYSIEEPKPEWSELVPETDQNALLEQLKSLRNPEVQKLELTVCFCSKQRWPLRFHCVAKKTSSSESDSISILCNHVELPVVSSKQLETPSNSSIDQLRNVALDAAPNSILVVDPDGKIVLANKQAEQMFQFSQEELLNQPVDILLPSSVRDKHPQLLASYFRNPSSRPMGAGRDLVGRKKDGTTVPIEIGLNPIDGVDGTFVFASIVDISERKLLEQKFRIALEAAPTAMIMINQLGQISLVNHQTEKLFGYDRKELLGQNIDMLVPESVRKVHPRHLIDFFKNPETRAMGSGRELTGRHKNGSEIPIEIGLNPITEGDEVQVIASVTDITVRTKQAEAILKHTQQLQHLAEVDPLTGLSNRYFFDEGLKQAIADAARTNETMGLIFLDLDKFKHVNDTLGHAAGDELLKAVAMRLKKIVRNEERLCRLGGDEFGIIIQHLRNPARARLLTQRLLEVFAKPFIISGRELTISSSIGIATYPDCATTPNQLMKCADVAMYRSKEAGRNQINFYSKTVHDEVHKRVNLEQDLQEAVKKGQFTLHYQPQVSHTDYKLQGVEALIRWEHPERGLISPLDFIPVAEEMGLIQPIGNWVINKACEQYSYWLQKYADSTLPKSIGINLSAVQLAQAGLVKTIRDALELYKLSASNLEIEITETAIDTSPMSLDRIHEISSTGAKLALDDFGVGYSSLSRLHGSPFQVLKIDKSFFAKVTDDQSDDDFLKAIHAFAQTLNFEIVAEGIETEYQRDLCDKLKVDRIQGYYFSKPLPAAEFESQFLTCSKQPKLN